MSKTMYSSWLFGLIVLLSQSNIIHSSEGKFVVDASKTQLLSHSSDLNDRLIT